MVIRNVPRDATPPTVSLFSRAALWVWAALVFAAYFIVLGNACNGLNPSFWLLDLAKWPICFLLAAIFYRILNHFQSKQPDPADTLHLTLAVAVLALPLLVLWFRSLGMTTYWWDSAQTVWRGKIFHQGTYERFSLTYAILGFLYNHLGGESALLSNCIALVFACIFLVAVYFILRQGGDRPAAVLSAWLLATTGPVVLLAEWIGLDMPLMASFSVTLWLFWSYWNCRRPWMLLALILSTAATILFKEYGILVVFVMILAAAILTQSRGVRGTLLGILGLLAVLVVVDSWRHGFIPTLARKTAGMTYIPFLDREGMVRPWWSQMYSLLEMQLHVYLKGMLLLPALLPFVRVRQGRSLAWIYVVMVGAQLVFMRLANPVLPDDSPFMPFDDHGNFHVALAIVAAALLVAWLADFIVFTADRFTLVLLAWAAVCTAAFTTVGQFWEGRALLDWRYATLAYAPLAGLAGTGLLRHWRPGAKPARVILAFWLALITCNKLATGTCYTTYYNNYRANMATGYQVARVNRIDAVVADWPFRHLDDTDLGSLRWRTDAIPVASLRQPQLWPPNAVFLVMQDIPKELEMRMPFMDVLWGAPNVVHALKLSRWTSPVKIGENVVVLRETEASRKVQSATALPPKDFFEFETVNDASPITVRGGVFPYALVVRNRGPRLWPPSVCVGVHLLDATGSKVVLYDASLRMVLPRPLLPHDRIRVEGVWELDAPPGDYVVAFDLVIDGLCWFSPRVNGAGMAKVPMRVLPPE